MPYIDVPIETEPVDLAEEAFGYIEQQVPGWLPSPGNLEAWLVEALSQTAGELRALAALVPDSIFAYLGESILGIPPQAAVQATGTTTWTALDGNGYTIPAGTLVGITPPSSSDAIAYEVAADFSIPFGTTVVADVTIRALEAGSAASGLTGSVQVLDALDFIEAVTLDAPTSGGADAETADAYLDRLSDLFTLLTPRPILPRDFAILAARQPGVARATAIDLYNPVTGETDSPRCVSVAVVDENGEPISAQAKADLDALLQAQREVNFLVFVIDPTYTTVDVSFQIASYPGYDPAETAARAEDAIASYLSPASWGVPPYGDTSARSWLNETTVRFLEVSERLNRVDGVHYVVSASLTIGVGGGAQGQADVVLPGAAPLPRPGAIVGSGVSDS